MANSNRYKMSQERLEELKKELNYMETVREKESFRRCPRAQDPSRGEMTAVNV